MTDSKEDLHSLSMKMLVEEALPCLKIIMTRARTNDDRIRATVLLKEIHEATRLPTIADELTKLSSLQRGNTLTADEFKKQKAKLLG